MPAQSPRWRPIRSKPIVNSLDALRFSSPEEVWRRLPSCPLLARAGRPSSLFAMLLSLPFSVIHETDRNRHPGDLAGQPFRERKRRAAVKRVHDGVEINVADFRRNAARGIGDSWWRDHLPVLLECKAHRHLHAGAGLLIKRRHPAAAQRSV